MLLLPSATSKQKAEAKAQNGGDALFSRVLKDPLPGLHPAKQERVGDPGLHPAKQERVGDPGLHPTAQERVGDPGLKVECWHSSRVLFKKLGRFGDATNLRCRSAYGLRKSSGADPSGPTRALKTTRGRFTGWSG